MLTQGRNLINLDSLKSDTDELGVGVAYVFVPAGGLIKVTDLAGHDTSITLTTAMPYLFCGIKRLWSTGTTATNVYGIS